MGFGMSFQEKVESHLEVFMVPFWEARDGRVKEDLRRTVYFVIAPDAQLIKIGSSADFDTRYGSLITMSPVPLRTLGTFEGSERCERALHKYLVGARSHGEWFRATRYVTALVEVVMKGGIEALCRYLEKLERHEIEKRIRRTDKLVGITYE